jgi:lipopolysaccharide transport system ATP-binding protein
MPEPMIRVSHLSKKYRIGATRVQYQTLRDSLVNTAKRLVMPFNKPSRLAESDTIWALDDVSFEIQPGEAVGVIGRNGAGKSTLLKLLSHITSPTHGRIELAGRVGSLLEVGTGFHNELTGRENIYLNGAILGMRRSEIQRKFDEIVAFAEIEKFLDTPVKHYSSGMYMRLAFAVAAHLEPEILLVDEVLAVGDAAFQRKCLGKMGDVTHQGRTVLFVSHNMAAISKLCQSCILLNRGKVASIDPPAVAVKKYFEAISEDITQWHERTGSGRVVVEKINLLDDNGDKTTQMAMGQSMTIEVYGRAVSTGAEFTSAIQLVAPDGTVVLYGSDQYAILHIREDLTFLARIHILDLMLMPGDYFLNVWIGQEGIETFDYIKSAAKITVSQGGSLPITYPLNSTLGSVFVKVNIESS